MSNKLPRSARIRNAILAAAVGMTLLLPILIYIRTFGFRIADDHQRWSEMGSAMSGIYTPILTIFTLLVLLAQVGLQEKMNRHTFDKSYVQEARSDVHFYLDQLAKEFSREFEDGAQIGPLLIKAFSYPKKEELFNSPLPEIAKALNRKHPGIMASWSAYYSVLAGLSVHDWYPYENAYIAAKQKAIAILSFEGCVALDHFIFSTTEGRVSYRYQFATELVRPT